MKKLGIIIAFLVLIALPIATADDIIFTVDQKEYYFLTGEQAIIPLMMNNTYEKDIDGTMRYTATQRINQGGSSYSSTNSQSQSFSVPKGNKTVYITFGQSDQPLQLDVSLEFSYTDDDTQQVITLDDITIYFVSNQSQQQNQQNPQQSTSQTVQNAEPSKNNQPQTQTPQQKLQNNQMSQDSQALKEQIQQQIAEEQSQREAFEQTVFNNSAFQQHHQDLLNQNYSLKQKQFSPENNDTGSFNFTYENKNGETASLQGNMEDGNIKNIQKQTAEDRKQMLQALNQSEQFQDYHQQLSKEGFNQTRTSFHQRGNETTVELNYENENNETAMITAEFKNKTLQEVSLEKEDPMNILIYIIPLIFLTAIILFFIYYRFFRKTHDSSASNKYPSPASFDYKQEAKRLLLKAEQRYKEKKYKDAYGLAGQSLRLYLGYEHGICRELTNDEIISFLKTKKYPYKQIKQCFDLCSLVEFAKYQTNETDFKRIISLVGKTITSST